jgi:transcriptional regulator with XRE-family HTH domain
MPESFGARLRQQREQRGIALGALAKQTRIKESLLEALERDDLSQWPSGFYRRAFFRAYASAIQLDPDVAFAEFQALYPEPPATDVMTAMAQALGRNEAPGRTMGLRSAVESAFSSLARFRTSPQSEQEVRAPEARPAGRPMEPPVQAPLVETPRAEVPAEAPPEPPVPPPVESPPVQPTLSAESAEPPADLMELARLCVELGCVTSEEDVQSLLQKAARAIGAAGLIVWGLHPHDARLQAALVHGYPRRLIAQLPLVHRNDNNATAEAFRTTETKVFNDTASGKCALAIPLRTASGCVGVFAVELERGLEATTSRIAVATLVAAQLAPIAECLSRPSHVGLPRAVNADVQAV